MKYIIKILFIYIILSINTIFAKDLEKVSIQLQWLDQFQFAGYYIAKEKGFYQDVGLNVEIKKFDYNISPITEVLNKKTTYAVGRSSLIINKSNGANIKILASIFQSSPLMLVATKNSGIKDIKDFKNRRIMYTPDAADTASLHAMTSKFGIYKKDIIVQKHSFNIDDLINNNTDLMASYVSNEPFSLKQKGIESIIFHPKDYGFDFYSDILFTHDDEIKYHKQRAINFINATLMGWEYAFNNIDETVELILKKYNTQNKTKDALVYEANELKKLAYYKTQKLGYIDIHKIQRIYDIYNIMGLVNNNIDLTKFIFYNDKYKVNNLTDEEIEYLKNNPVLKVHNELNWKPFNFNEDGVAKGYSIDYMNLLAKKLNIKVEYIYGYSWKQFLEQIKDNSLDVMLNIISTQDREKYISFTKPYKTFYHTIYTRADNKYYSLQELNDKKRVIAVVKDYAAKELIRSRYKDIRFYEVDKPEDLFKALNFRQVDAVVAIPPVANQTMLDLSIKNIVPTNEAVYKNNQPKIINLSIGVSKNKRILKNILQKAMDSVTNKEKLDLEGKWLIDIDKSKKGLFTVKEQNYLNDKKQITMCIDPNWLPFEAFDENNQYIGLSADFFKIFEKNLPIKVKTIQTKTWEESLQFAKDRKCDIISLAMETPKRKEYLNFTAPYLKTPLVLATKPNVPFVENFSTFRNEKLGIPKGYAYVEFLRDKYPNLNIIEVDNIKSGLEKVVKGELYGYIGTLASVGYLFQKEFTGELKIAGKFDEKWELGTAVRNDDKILLSIFEKLIKNIDENTRQKILNNWLAINYEQNADYSLVWKILIGVILLISIIVYRQMILKKHNMELLEAQEEIKLLNNTLEARVQEELRKNQEKDVQLLQQSRFAQMGEMISMIAHQWRQPLTAISATTNNLMFRLMTDNFEKNEFETEIKLISNYSQHLSKTIDDFRNFFKADKVKTEANLTQIVNETLDIVRISVENKNIKIIKSKVCNCKETINTYPNELKQVVLNLIKNAEDALIEKGIIDPFIDIKIYKDRSNHIIDIVDNAGGIPEEFIGRVFDPYFTTKEEKDGTGLGLYMSKTIVEEHCGGKLSCLNTKDGVLFRIEI